MAIKRCRLKRHNFKIETKMSKKNETSDKQQTGNDFIADVERRFSEKEIKAVEQNECCGSLDLEEMDKRLDLQLTKETKESLTEWLESKRNNTSP